MGQQSSGQPSGDATLRIGTISALPAILRSLGADPAEVLAEAGFALEQFEDPDNLVSLVARGRLIAHCVARTGCQHLGLLVGQRGGLHSLGLVGLLVKYSPDVQAALHSLVSYFHLHARGVMTTLVVDEDVAMLSYGIYAPDVLATDQIGDGAVAMLLNIMRTLCGPDWRPIEARFARRKPQDVRPFRRLCRAPLRFDAEQNALVFSADWLERRLPAADPELQRLLQKQIDALEVKHGDDFPAHVRSVLRATLMTDHASADQVAALFSMHSRTLSRRLHASGTSFQELVDEGRFEIARQLLANTALDVRQIAASLDYADASAFTRAFRRWSGTTPAVWRAQQSPL
jgi:AraC-like DNA-binding protein